MSVFKPLTEFCRNKKGNAAIEFGLIAPVLIVSLVMMLDAGFALGQRLELDRNVRAGVQATIASERDLNTIRDFVLSSSDDPAAMTVNVTKTCSCGGVAVACTDWCSADVPPAVFINISAVQDYDGVMLPPFTLNAETYVQLR